MNYSLSRELLRSASKLAIAVAAAGFLASCTGADSFSSSDGASPAATLGGIEPDGQDFVGGAAFWGAKYEANRDDLAAGMGFARNLRMMGGARQAVAVLKEIVMKAPDNPRVLSEYGKALTAAGRVQDALPFLVRSTQINGDDWTTFSAYGVALDQTGNHKTARENYQTALSLSPGNSTVESNLAMSHVLEGDIDKAELILRRLVAQPDATPQMRQNLAMVSAIKGNAAEAEQLAREDLVPSDATNNLTLLQQFDARNVAINVQPLAAPSPAPVTSGKPAAEAEPAPVGANSENSAPNIGASAELAGPAAATVAPAPVPAVAIPPAPFAPKSAPYTMMPIADDEDPQPAKAVAPKAPAQPRSTPGSASLTGPANKQDNQLTPAAASPVDEVATPKPTAVLRKSFDVYRRPSRVKVATAAQ
jgi:Flp pilus assembly protein TadD